MKSLKYLIIFLMIFLNSNLKAADGCVISSITYTRQVGVTNVFYESPSSPASTCWTGNYIGTCQVCIGGLLTVNIPPVLSVCLKLTAPFGFTNGSQYSNYTEVQCNLDDYSLPLVAATGIFGLLVIRKRNKK